MPPAPPGPNPQAIAASLRAAGASEEQIADVMEAIAPPEDVVVPEDAPRNVRAEVEARIAAGEALDGIDLSGGNLSGMDLSGQSLVKAKLLRARLCGADLSRAVLTGAQASGADFTDAVLDGADAGGADFAGATLRARAAPRGERGGLRFLGSERRRGRFSRERRVRGRGSTEGRGTTLTSSGPRWKRQPALGWSARSSLGPRSWTRGSTTCAPRRLCSTARR